MCAMSDEGEIRSHPIKPSERSSTCKQHCVDSIADLSKSCIVEEAGVGREAGDDHLRTE